MPRAGTTRADYGNAHQKLRKQFKVQVELGNAWCWRCGKWIQPGTPWDLGHDDFDTSMYRGPEHRACNRATSGRNGNIPVTNWVLGVPRKGRTCEVCGASYDANHKYQRTCGKTCGMEIRRRNGPGPSVVPLLLQPEPFRTGCAECGADFERRHPSQRYCGGECAKRANGRKARDRYRNSPAWQGGTYRTWAL